jgi:trehalose 6-phosphate synthase
MNRLVVVSNRVPTPGSGNTAGGLAIALEGLMGKRGGVWFGWSGAISSDAAAKPIHSEMVDGVCYATVDLTQEEHDSYYGRFSNGVLWPLLHTMPQLMDYERRDAQTYRDVNARFADALVQLLKPNDIVWVHDYHLLALPALLRARGVRNPIGFFLHIPFPSPDVLSSAPEAAALTRDLLGADLIGFQTDRDVANFTAAASQIAGAVALEDGWLGLYGRRIRLGAFPVEIEAQDFADTAARAAATPAAERLRRSLQGQKLILGVDRLDPTKGLVQRLDGLRRLLETRPSWRRNLTLLQIAAVSRKDVQAYQELREELDREAGALNSEYGDPDWSPLRIIARGAVRSVVAGYMRLASVGLVTPLRDGMNLVAKEYVAAQDPDDPGVLVLSRFAGAARQLDSAILVNPHDPDDMADAMDRALRMDLDERRARQAALWKVIENTSPVTWGRTFLAEMVRAVTAGDAPAGTRPKRDAPITAPRGKTQTTSMPPDLDGPSDPRQVN